MTFKHNKITILNNIISQAFQSGFMQIFLASIFSYFVSFAGSIVYARLMGAYDYGVYSFAFNVISIILLVNGFGAASGILQYVSKHYENPQMQLSYLKLGITNGFGFNLVLSIIIILYALFANLPIIDAKYVLIAMAFFPIGRLYIDVFHAYLRATKQNNLLAQFAISANSLLLFTNIIGVYYWKIFGLIVATYISYVLIILWSIYIYRFPNPFTIKSIIINYKDFISYSIYSTIGNAFSQLVFVLDIFLLSYLIKDPIILSSYKVASIIPFAITFIPGVIISFFYPTFVANIKNTVYIKYLYKKIMLSMLVFSVIISLLLIILAKPIIVFIFGDNYITSIEPFRILSFGFWILASFRTISGNILASLGHAKFSMWVNLCIMIFNLIITYYLILNYGKIFKYCEIK